MRNIHPGKVFATLVAALALGACGSSGLGDVFGGPSQAPATAVDEVRGTVRYVDTSRDCLIELEDTRFTRRSNLRNDSGDLGSYRDGDRLTLVCNDQTVVMHQGRSYRPQALERGDEIAARVNRSGSRLLVDRIDVLYDVSGDRATAPRSSGDLRGTVRSVDTQNRTIVLDRVEVFDRTLEAYGSRRVTLLYDTDTDVMFEGRRYRAENLEPGDEVEVDVTEVRGRLIAESIEVVSDVRASR
jgi:hypothetical protein